MVLGALVGFLIRPRHAKTEEYAAAIVSPSEAMPAVLCVLGGLLIGYLAGMVAARFIPRGSFG
jgi:hypothetical protein